MSAAQTLWRDEDVDRFTATVAVAAEQLQVQPLAVEKDYWVCEALRALVIAFPDQIVFKGGTSLEKLRIIQRFSEDLDLLVVGSYSSDNQAKKSLKNMFRQAAAAVGDNDATSKSGGKSNAFHREGYVTPPLTRSATTSPGIADPASVLIELGQTGGPNPHRTSPLTRCAEPPTAGRESAGSFMTFTRCWATATFWTFWPTNKRWRQILQSAQAVSAGFGRPDQVPPAGGFAECRVFDPDWEHASRLRSEHETAMQALYYGPAGQAPTFDAVVARVHHHAELLAAG